MVTQGNSLFLGYREVVGRQQPMRECGLGDAGLRQQAQREELPIPFERPVSTAQVRRHIILFADSRGLGPVLTMSNMTFWGWPCNL